MVIQNTATHIAWEDDGCRAAIGNGQVRDADCLAWVDRKDTVGICRALTLNRDALAGRIENIDVLGECRQSGSQLDEVRPAAGNVEVDGAARAGIDYSLPQRTGAHVIHVCDNCRVRAIDYGL